MIDAVGAADPSFSWGPYLAVGLAAALTAIGWMLTSLIRLTTAVAVLVEHNKGTDSGLLDSKKAHDELIDNKLATAELNVARINQGDRIERLESAVFESTFNRTRESK